MRRRHAVVALVVSDGTSGGQACPAPRGRCPPTPAPSRRPSTCPRQPGNEPPGGTEPLSQRRPVTQRQTGQVSDTALRCSAPVLSPGDEYGAPRSFIADRLAVKTADCAPVGDATLSLMTDRKSTARLHSAAAAAFIGQLIVRDKDQ